MSSSANLRLSSSSGPSPDYKGKELASARYCVPTGWMFLFSPQQLTPFTDPENTHLSLTFYRSPVGEAVGRLRRAIEALRKSQYLWEYFQPLETLLEALLRHSAGYVEVEYDELIMMGAGRFGKRILAAAQNLQQAVESLEAGSQSRARRLINQLAPVSGMKLHGFRFLDHAWWWTDRKFMGIPTDKELSQWWSFGVLDSDAPK